MARTVAPIYELEYRGKMHRFLEFESDNSVEFEELMATAANKGWELYVQGNRPDRPGVQAAMFCKPKD